MFFHLLAPIICLKSPKSVQKSVQDWSSAKVHRRIVGGIE
jgi:hypothetical protein